MEPLLEVKGIKKHFPVAKGLLFSKTIGWIKAVDDVDLSIGDRETVGLVGESGCGIVDTRTVGSTWGREHPDRCIARAKWSTGRHHGPVSPRNTNFSGVYRRQLASQAIEGHSPNEPSRDGRRQKAA